MNKRTKKLLAMMSAKPKLMKISGLPPLTYKAKKAGFLTDYRIYGQTSRNLFDEKQQMTTGVITNDGTIDNTESSCEYSDFIEMLPNVDYTIRATYSTQKYIRVAFYDSSKNFIERALSTSITPTITFNKNANYIRICVDKEWSTIMLNAGTPLPYEPYGESVGDRTGNLFDGELTDNYHLDSTTGLPVGHNDRFATLQPITIKQGEYCLTYNSTTNLRFMYSVFNDDTLIRRVAIINDRYLQSGDAIDTTGGNKIYFAFYNNDYSDATTGMISNIMLNSGSTSLPYEPYGYRVPVTVSNGTDTLTTPIYLPEQIKKVGDEAEYIDYGEQKFHRISGADLDVTLPALPTLTGTNVLSVGTEVQPSLVEVTGRIRPVPTGGGE